MFRRLFKIEQQRQVYGEQVYDVLGDSMINTQLQDLLIKAIRSEFDVPEQEFTADVIENEIGRQLEDVLRERALVSGLGDQSSSSEIRRLMEQAKARKLQPWFVESFFGAALSEYGGRMSRRERGRWEVTRVPASIRAQGDAASGFVHDRYHRIRSTGRKSTSTAPTKQSRVSGNPLLNAVIDQVLTDHTDKLQRNDPHRPGRHQHRTGLSSTSSVITDGRTNNGQRQIVSRQFHYAEVSSTGEVSDPGPEPYLNYTPLTADQQELLAPIDADWADDRAEDTARSWVIDRIAGPHFQQIETIVHDRVDRVREAVRERLEAEIRYWDLRAEEIKADELKGKKPRLNSGRARPSRRPRRPPRPTPPRTRPRSRRPQPAARVTGAAPSCPNLIDQLAGAEPDDQNDHTKKRSRKPTPSRGRR